MFTFCSEHMISSFQLGCCSSSFVSVVLVTLAGRKSRCRFIQPFYQYGAWNIWVSWFHMLTNQPTSHFEFCHCDSGLYVSYVICYVLEAKTIKLLLFCH